MARLRNCQIVKANDWYSNKNNAPRLRRYPPKAGINGFAVHINLIITRFQVEKQMILGESRFILQIRKNGSRSLREKPGKRTCSHT